jgi:hypothetical protein
MASVPNSPTAPVTNTTVKLDWMVPMADNPPTRRISPSSRHLMRLASKGKCNDARAERM